VARTCGCVDGLAAGRFAEGAIEAFRTTGLAAAFLAAISALLLRKTVGAFGALCLVLAKPVPANTKHKQAAKLSMREYMPAPPLLYLCHSIRSQFCIKQKIVFIWDVGETT
jgi:hypothetical protein